MNGVPSGVFSLADLDRLPGIRPLQSPPTDVIEHVRALENRYGAVRQPRAVGQRLRPNAAAQRDHGIPPAMDSGDPDPDRLKAPSFLLTFDGRR